MEIPVLLNGDGRYIKESLAMLPTAAVIDIGVCIYGK